ncbi:MAG TPA: GumC family protein, partial [Saliniramus sp.]|nr:GumC family protein [Saliniramus sp.]
MRELLATVLRRKNYVILSIMIFVAIAFATIAALPPIYRRSAQVMIDPRGLVVVSSEVLPPAPSSDVYDAIIDTQVRLMTSDAVLEGVVVELGLQSDPEFVPPRSFLGQIKAAILGTDAEPPTEADLVGFAADTLSRQIDVRRELRSFIVTISASSLEAEKSAAIAGRIVEGFLAASEDRRRSMTIRAREALTSSLTAQRDRLAAAENAVEDYKAEFGIVDEDGRLLNTGRLTELNRQLLEARNDAHTLGVRLEQIEEMRRSPLVAEITLGTLDSEVLAQLRTTYAQVLRQRDNLRITLGPRHPQVVEIEEQAASTRRAIAQEASRVASTIRSEFESATAREQTLADDLARLEGRTTEANSSLVGLRELEREALAQRTVYENFLERERELREQEAISSSSTYLITEARAPSKPLGVLPLLLIVVAIGLGGFLGAGAAIARERLDGRIHSASRMASRTGIQAFGELPLDGRKLMRPRAKPFVGTVLAGRGGTPSSRLVYFVGDILKDWFGDDPATILVVSPCASALQPVVSLSLALAEASSRRTTLFVDARDPGEGDPLLADGRGMKIGLQSLLFKGHDDSPLDAAVLNSSRDPAHLQLSLGYRSLEKAFASYRRSIVNVAPDIGDATLRDLADTASTVVVVVEKGVTTFAEVEAMQLALGRNAEKIAGALLITQGSDPIAPLVRQERDVVRIAAA